MKINKIKLGLSGGIVMAIFVLLVEVFLWIKFVPLYNSLMVNLYAVTGYNTSSLILIFALFIVLGFVLGFILTWLSALIYNKFSLSK